MQKNTNETIAIPNNEVLVGIDYGESNIGVALGRNGYVTPIRIVNGKNPNGAINEISNIVIQNKCTKIIVGLPLSSDKKETITSKKARAFVKLLKIYLKIPILFQNEYGTTIESIDEAIDFGIAKRQRAKTDDLAAALILKNYYRETYGN